MRQWSIAVLGVLAAAGGLAVGRAGIDLGGVEAAEPGSTTKSGVERSAFDVKVRPQDDLFRHVNGGWIQSAEIPAEQPMYGSFIQLRDRSEADLRAIIEAAAARTDHKPGSEAQKIGDLFAAFMDEARVESLGLKPIEGDLAAVAEVKDKAGFVETLARLQRQGVSGLFGLFVDTDAKKSDEYIIYLNQGGISLPDESYYRDSKFEEIRKAYVAHVGRMFELAGATAEQAKADAETVMKVETALAKNHWDRVKNRDDTLTYNRHTVEELVNLAPNFAWVEYGTALGVPHVEAVIVRQPDFFKAMSKLVEETPLDAWKTWLKYRVLRDAAPVLSKKFVDESFSFFGKTLTGVPENKARWKRGVALVEGSLGEAVGKLYVEKHFPPAAKARMQELVKNLIEAYRVDIQALDWMSPETKTKALDKLAKFTPKIGYPDKWRDYSKLEIRRDDLVGNARRAEAFELERNLGKLGRPIDRSEWLMTPQTVNAYYNPGMNEIVFPAAILQPPFFDLEADDAVNYGGIGAVIGHEIGHGFDDQGSKFDGDGNMKDWWTDKDRAEFDKRTKKLIEQYNAFEPSQLPGSKVNGALTVGENIGDLGGLTIAFKAYQIALKGQPSPKIDGYSGEQRVFIGFAQIWRAKYRDTELKRRLVIDPHSPTEFRCNGVIRNLPEFYAAFGVKEGDKLWLAPEQRVRIW